MEDPVLNTPSFERVQASFSVAWTNLILWVTSLCGGCGNTNPTASYSPVVPEGEPDESDIICRVKCFTCCWHYGDRYLYVSYKMGLLVLVSFLVMAICWVLYFNHYETVAWFMNTIWGFVSVAAVFMYKFVFFVHPRLEQPFRDIERGVPPQLPTEGLQAWIDFFTRVSTTFWIILSMLTNTPIVPPLVGDLPTHDDAAVHAPVVVSDSEEASSSGSSSYGSVAETSSAESA